MRPQIIPSEGKRQYTTIEFEAPGEIDYSFCIGQNTTTEWQNGVMVGPVNRITYDGKVVEIWFTDTNSGDQIIINYWDAFNVIGKIYRKKFQEPSI